MKIYTLFFFLLIPLVAISQIRPSAGPGGQNAENASKQEDTIKPPISAYKIISIANDTTFVDTTLTIEKDYKFNYRRKDNFELLSFSNTGRPYNKLGIDFDAQKLYPEFGAQARHYNFLDVEDINYYHVPTPFTEAYFKTVPEQGQQLDVLFTMNTSERLNFSVGYKGVRALGRYQNMLTSTGIFKFGLTYKTLDKKYHLRSHFVSHDLMNQENGGFSDLALQQYIDKEEEFEDRSLLQMNFENAENTLYGKRFYLDHYYHLAKPDSLSSNALKVGHIFNHDYKKFDFLQTNSVNEIFGPSFQQTNLRDRVRLTEFYNEGYVQWSNETLGEVKAKAAVKNFEYGYKTFYIRENDTINNKLTGVNYAIGGEYNKSIGGFDVKADAMLNLAGDFTGSYFAAQAGYSLDEENRLQFGFNQNSHMPNYNFLLYQSNYVNYNWQNNFDNVNTQSIYGELRSKKLLNIEARLTQIQNYTYFTEGEDRLVKPFQSGDQVRYLKLKASKDFDFGLFAIDNTLMYQNVMDGASVLNLPEFVTRNTIYYKDEWFDKALYLQTGFTFKYFTNYNMNAYDPVLAELYVQNSAEFGNYPVVDFFFNGKVDQTRIFFKLQHLNSLIDKNNNFVAPGYPYADFQIRFGVVWNFFL
ncbi:Putative porin [Salegentibacter holothuriorum]|uniref:Putative porin n=1 Tax=Salegentibacter holothuriorum TaxID=241145 RepID=A0A1T5BBY6_9FLAO|nr:putative porin [Salegentibacter holothuriorum]SKB44645.1 Putative porin [Salegentibacter holothuriorum]